MKRKLLLLALITICAATIASGTIAYFTAEDRADNIITSGKVGIELVEKTKDLSGAEVEFPTDGITGVMPGTSASKIVSVNNTGDADAWIRVQVEMSITGKDGASLPMELTAEGATIPVLTLDIDTENWIDGGDGFYYYKLPVAPGTSTSALFKEVYFAKEMGNEYQECSTIILVSAQAVQSANNPIPDGGDVTGVKGWPQI